MNVNNSQFDDYPIEFKEINPTDFPYLTIENNRDKVIISPNSDGYITEELLANIDITQKSTVVVNAGVGQGKTTAIIEVVKKFYLAENEDYLIFIASPFVSLVEQYYNLVIEKGINENDIYRYEFIGERPEITYIDKKVHIITVNGLLGNPGEDAYINSKAKRIYLETLSKHCESTGMKVIIIMDEIHDAIHNFKEQYIFNLWKWKSTVHKNFILSATYNEASKVVLEYLAELTDDRLKIIESERIRIPRNQSELYLHFNPAKYYKNENPQLVELVKSLIENKKAIDILCFSKTLADSITQEKNKGVGVLLQREYEDINNCTTYLVNNQRLGRLTKPKNRYNNEMCNVGTNFKTGVSIEKQNHAFIIILPSEGTKMPFKNTSGVFTDGVNSIIQALARQRKRGGEIHLFLPPPEEFNFESLPFEGVKKAQFSEFYNEVKSIKQTNYPVKYVPFNIQNLLLRSFYESELKENLEDEIRLVNNSNRNEKPSLNFPDFKSFILTDGEGYLANSYKFFGADLSSYVTYAAFTNQFLNCKLSGYTAKPQLGFKDGYYQQTFQYFFNTCYLNEDRFGLYEASTDFNKYLEFKNDLFVYYKLFSLNENGNRETIELNKNRHFETQLLGFMHRTLYPDFNEHFLEDDELKDYEYSRGDYLLSNISSVALYNLEDNDLSEKQIKRIKAFKSLKYFREKLLGTIVTSSDSNRGEFRYISNKPPRDFIVLIEYSRFNEMIDYLVEEDYFISRGIFEFKQRFKPSDSIEKKINSFYTKIAEDFLKTTPHRLSTGRRNNVKIITNIKNIPDTSNTLDLIGLPNYEFSEKFWENNTYEVINGILIKKTS
ncbi:MAG: DEAD/DEAH box helicase family protein [Flavobacteriales bacterium]|nr:DEAD/DEAH box helicase family protein [Flavobacteriales bacterium]